MAIKKSVVVENLSNNKAINKLEKKIDSKLQTEYGKHGNFMNMTIPAKTDGSVIAEIKKRYTEAGWSVTSQTDIRSPGIILLSFT